MADDPYPTRALYVQMLRKALHGRKKIIFGPYGTVMPHDGGI